MELEHMIENMKKALKRDKLVIFVGAGVSKNSGIPTWGQMVRLFAERMDYPVNRLSTTEYIRIPQYFYGMDQSEHHEEYYRILQETISMDVKPNPLNELIAQIHPKHIVTTNYDKLMDEVADGYEIIREEKDFLKTSANHYLIKMHGDMDQVRHIVFKEDDYLQYSETHRLTETFLKSLNTFTSWIDYIAQEMNVKEHMHKNYFLSSSNHASKQYLHRYYQNKGLQVIDLYNLPTELEQKMQEVPLEEELGRRTYIVLQQLIN